jgi:sulfatase maturation enzyme AslB (radical SAM superfamily)
MRLTTSGSARNIDDAIVGRITTQGLPQRDRHEHIRFLREGESSAVDLSGYRAVLSHDEVSTVLPVVDRLRESDHFRDGDVIVMEGGNGFVRSLYRPHERHHSLFVTERCSSNCLMCSQPPKDKDDVPSLTKRNQQLIDLMRPAPEYLTITGGEPTLLGDNLFLLITRIP